MGPFLSVSGVMRWSCLQGFYIEQRGDRKLLLTIPRLMRDRADDLLHARVNLHGWFESPGCFAVHSLASAEG